MGWHQILGLLCFLFFLHPSLPFAFPLCPPDQRDALLLFKNSFALDAMASSFSCDEDLYYPITSYPKTNAWNVAIDCCSWDGVACDGSTGDVVSLDLACSWLYGNLHPNSSLLLLRHLRSLNLSGNNFAGSRISPNLSAFAQMTHLNLSRSHFFGTVPSEIACLSKLVSLDLSYNYDESNSFSSLVLENSVFAMLVQNLTAMKKLGLDAVDMSMVSPISFANLSSSLTHLRVSACSLEGMFPDIVFRFPSLTILYAHSNPHMSGSLPKFNWTGPLVYLSLEGTDFSREIPNSIGNMKRLTVLVLSDCRFTGHIPSSLWNLKQLQILYLVGNNFSGVVNFENFTKFKNLHMLNVSLELNLTYNTLEYTFPKLEVLGLSFCNLTKFPRFLSSLKRLISLDLSSNRISGEIPSSICQLISLQYLRLSNNGLSGNMPPFAGNMTNLISLDLSFNRISGEIPSSICQLSSLQYLCLSNNSLSGNMPPCVGNMTNLISLDLSSNRISGEIPSSICQLSSLQYLCLSNNTLSGNMQPCVGNMTNLIYLYLSRNKLQGPLPRSLVKCVNLLALILNENEFADIFPHWLEAPRLYALYLWANRFYGSINLTTFGLVFPALEYLLISYNSFTGQWPPEVFSNTSLAVIDLTNNKFGGPIPLPSPSTVFYSIASNNFTGKIPSLICNATKLEYLDLSNNSLTGGLPRCLTNFSIDLLVLNLRMNHLEGTIPQSFSWRNSLATLDLSQNRLEGTLPPSLVRCNYLEILDLSSNRIEDKFPRWLGTLPELKVLILRSNNFKDILNLPKGAHLFPKLRILDLSNNNFGGPLPSNLIMHLKAMMYSKNGQNNSLYMARFSRIVAGYENSVTVGYKKSIIMGYENSVTVSIKGQIELLVSLNVFTIIDLSHNSFQGDIPRVIGHLHSLIGLNLSHNQLTGSIPDTLGNLTNLEWLDLSSNKLGGVIPRKLGDLTFLGYLNLSKNQLTGRIPQDKQLSTFSSDSFGGNPGLCGMPLPKACLADAYPPTPSINRKVREIWIIQNVVWVGYATGIVIGISIAYITFETGRPKWLARGVRMLERKAAEWMEKPKQKAIKFRRQ